MAMLDNAMINTQLETPVELTHKVIFITHQLGMYQAELARVLHLQCPDIGRLASGKAFLDPESVAWQKARQFVRFYELLSERLLGEEVAMYHWLRTSNELFKTEPLLMIVDHGQLESVIRLLESGHDIRQGKTS